MPLGRRFLEEFLEPDLRLLPEEDFDFDFVAGLAVTGLASIFDGGLGGTAAASATAVTGFVVGTSSLASLDCGDVSLGEFEVDGAASEESARTRA